MTARFSFFGATTAMLCLSAATASAEVTPAQVWNDLESYVKGFGYSVTATETAQGNDLRLTDVSFAMILPEGEGSFAFEMSEVLLSDTGDGSVQIAFPQSMPIVMDFTSEDEEDVSLVIDYTHTGLEMVVSGDPGALEYTYSADELGMALTDMTVDGKTVGREIFRLDVIAGPVEGTSTVVVADEMRDIAQAMSMGQVTFDIAFNDPDSTESGLFTGRLSDLAFEGTSLMPVTLTPEMLTNMLAAGVEGGGTFSHQGGETQFAVTDGGETTTGQTSSDSGAFTVEISGENLRYDVGSTGIAMQFAGGEIPLPVDVKMAEMGMVFDIPTAASETPEDIELAVTLAGFTMSDLLWNIFDPGKVLPRDPATIAIDLAGQVTPFISLFDAEAMAALEDGDVVPGELNALTLRGLTVEAAGAKLTGTGDVTFDNSDLESFDGLPKPTGEVNLQLVGANALIDKLIQMGLVQESDAMGARMMMGMFTVPGSGPDDLSSKLEINDAGHILANGQRIK